MKQRTYVEVMTKKEFDAVRMMREIRDELATRFSNPEVEEKELEAIRKKYGIAKAKDILA